MLFQDQRQLRASLFLLDGCSMNLNIIPSRNMIVRNMLTPAAAGLFFACAVSGVALFFHVRPEFFHEAHEWIGIFFVVIALGHALRHWRSFASYLKNRASVSVLVVLVVASAAFAVMTNSSNGVNPRAVLQVLSKSSVTNVAAAFGVSPEQAVLTFKAKGIEATEGQTLDEIARNAHASPLMLMSLLSGKGAAPN